MNIKKGLIKGAKNRSIDYDMRWETLQKGVVVFAHGYKGFKDWGCWDLVGNYFAKKGYVFLKFNFSHNGHTLENPLECSDLEAFSNNTYTIEKQDCRAVLDWVMTNECTKSLPIFLIGHSRGGGIALLNGNHRGVQKVASWAGVCDFEARFPKAEAFELWKKQGVHYILNGRTKQLLPHKFEFYLDFKRNQSELSIKNAVKKMDKPILLVHAKNDAVVDVREAHIVQNINLNLVSMVEIPNSSHTFDAYHPYEKAVLPKVLKMVCEATMSFFQKT